MDMRIYITRHITVKALKFEKHNLNECIDLIEQYATSHWVFRSDVDESRLSFADHRGIDHVAFLGDYLVVTNNQLTVVTNKMFEFMYEPSKRR